MTEQQADEHGDRTLVAIGCGLPHPLAAAQEVLVFQQEAFRQGLKIQRTMTLGMLSIFLGTGNK